MQTNFAIDIYKQMWPNCEVIENDSLGKSERTARILDFGDVDKIILLPGEQRHMAQRFRKPYKDGIDPDFTLRYSRPYSDNVIEYERLMNAVESDSAAYPRRYSFGRVYQDHTKGIYELYILNTELLIKGIKSDEIKEKGPIPVNEGQEMMAYSIKDIQNYGAVEQEWFENETAKSERPDNPSQITNW